MEKEILEKLVNEKKNLIVEGSLLSGKTLHVLFPIVNKIIEQRESLFILDAKEEYLNQYYEMLKEKDYNIIVVNLKDMEKGEGWNPLEYPYSVFQSGDSDKAQEYLEKIGNILFPTETNADPFWSQAASDFFIGVTLALFEDGTKDEVHFDSVYQMVQGSDKKIGNTDYVSQYFKIKGPLSKSYIYSSTTLFAPPETKSSIVSVARQQLRLYISKKKLLELMGQTTFDVKEIDNKPTAILFVTRDDNRTLSGLTTIFIEQLYAILCDLDIKRPFHFILDNFDTIQKSNDLLEMLSSCLPRKMKFYLATRSIEQVVNQYGNYIQKLCDKIILEENHIRCFHEKIESQFEILPITVPFKTCLGEYPVRKLIDIPLFDLEKFVNVHRGNEQIEQSEEKINNHQIENLIKKIDDRILQLELEESKLKEDHKISPDTNLES